MSGVKTPLDQTEPRDTHKIAYAIHFLLGAGNLLPWNAFITSVDYFGSLYPKRHVERTFSVAYMTSSLLSLLLVIASRGGKNRRLSSRALMNLGFSIFVSSVILVPVLDWAWRGGSSAYGVTVASVTLCGLADGLVGGSLMASVARLPRQYMQAVFAGTASSGVLVSLLRISTKAMLPQDQKGLMASAHLYFLVATMILLCCIISCNLLHKLPIMQQLLKLQQQDNNNNADTFRSAPQIRSTTRRIKWPAFGIFAIYLVTLSIFPGFIAENLESKLLRDWYPILLITVYNIADLAGKSLTAIYTLESVTRTTWLCVARLVFYPLFVACLHGPRWSKTEIPVAFLTFALGLTNGYLTSVMMIRVPKSVPLSEAESSAMIMVVFLGFGLVAGSVLGWFWII